MTTTPRSTTDEGDDTAVQQAKETVRDVADQVRSVASEAAARLPEAAATTRDAIVDAQRRIDSGSDETLSAGTLVAFGFALGLLVGGANRLLVMLALVPAAAMGLTLLDRQNPRPAPRPSSTR
ncbi:MAG: hypothetical protein QOD78_100 [Chloroflexota bacterium]|jgi:hypothetical protein|nr:hypothetical protein [Chloroflexota bacterium]MEA2613551.1 hypothetical protein [Chloroflexota bacterium]